MNLVAQNTISCILAVPSAGTPSEIAASIKSLESKLGSAGLGLAIATALVVIGLLIEYFDDVKEVLVAACRSLRLRRLCDLRSLERKVVITVLGGLFVTVGVAAELLYEHRTSVLESSLETENGELIAFLNEKASAADERSKILENETQGLKTKADEAKLELARLIGPPHLIPVRDGIAIPDLSAGNKQVVLLNRDTRIILPRLPKGKSLSWTLFVTQDGVGQHQFATSPQVMPGNTLYSPPHSSWILTLVTDSNGTIDTALGGATFSAAPSGPVKK